MWTDAHNPVRLRQTHLWRELNPSSHLPTLQELRTRERARPHRSPVVKLYDDGEAFVLIAEVPGVPRELLQLEATARRLELSGSRSLALQAGERRIHQERSAWSFERSFALADPIVVDQIAAELEDGILTVRAPKQPDRAARRIEIGASAVEVSG